MANKESLLEPIYYLTNVDISFQPWRANKQRERVSLESPNFRILMLILQRNENRLFKCVVHESAGR